MGKIINITLCKAGIIDMDVFCNFLFICLGIIANMNVAREGAFKEGEFIKRVDSSRKWCSVKTC